MRDCPTDLARRGRLRALALVLVASAGLAAAAQPLSAQTKMSKQEAEYQDTPKDIRMGAACTLFEAPLWMRRASSAPKPAVLSSEAVIT